MTNVMKVFYSIRLEQERVEKIIMKMKQKNNNNKNNKKIVKIK